MYKVLIVDDEETIRTGIQVGVDWERLRCTVIGLASDGTEALRLMQSTVPDILLSDISMHPMDGLALCAAVNEKYPAMKCILLTGFYDFQNACQAIKFGVVELLLKPTSPAKISDAIVRAINKIEETNVTHILSSEIHSQALEHLALKQSMLLQNIFNGTDYGAQLPQLLAEADINLTRFCAVAIRIHGTASQELPPHFCNTTQTIRKYIVSVMKPLSYYTTYQCDPNIELLVNVPQINPLPALRQKCKELSDMIDTLTDFYITIGISNVHEEISQLQQASLEADDASKFTAYTTDDPIIEYASLPHVPENVMEQVYTLMTAVSESIPRFDFDESHALLKQLQTFCMEHQTSFTANYNICLCLLNVCFQQCINYNIEGFSLNDQYSLGSKLDTCQTIDQLYLMLERTIGLVSTSINIRSKPDDLVNRVVSYIQTNYASQLSLESIAGVFSISTGYLGRIFKNRMNTNLLTYIQTVRIEHAKELIVSSDLYTYQIAEAVGISDPVYFSKLFKKITGCRVKDFRTQQ